MRSACGARRAGPEVWLRLAMAILLGEDEEVQSGLDFQLLAPGTPAGWWRYRLAAWAGSRRLVLAPDPADTDDRCCLPAPEALALCQGLGTLLAGRRDRYLFEPAEPNFQLEADRYQDGYRIFVWLDAGNQFTSHFTWDAAGVRFYTEARRLAGFLTELAAELASHGIAADPGGA